MAQAAKQLEKERSPQEAQVALATDGRWGLRVNLCEMDVVLVEEHALSDESTSPSDRRLKGTDAFTTQELDPYLCTSTIGSEDCMLTENVDWLAVAGSLLTWKGAQPKDGGGSYKDTSCHITESMAMSG
ncbi:hypothetical protein VDBG_04379 [Verticillium alfalfae VaMs.102]|uniref:Uncharacterized protein n=1 Tax=Verticillium alfalfae (strain VaMs.102 / ATCC MYA-4576 / FGSC 10136) TaxID=526221 RepID=C9SJA8_VERA1|nr:hypothetical protein VDBG_04379 [Verticillium alfalfae VaMs.102]EEY18270.1 hypothetical protein VDBG_04379 [Verticillium alfalfae VaMs.102]